MLNAKDVLRAYSSGDIVTLYENRKRVKQLHEQGRRRVASLRKKWEEAQRESERLQWALRQAENATEIHDGACITQSETYNGNPAFRATNFSNPRRGDVRKITNGYAALLEYGSNQRAGWFAFKLQRDAIKAVKDFIVHGTRPSHQDPNGLNVAHYPTETQHELPQLPSTIRLGITQHVQCPHCQVELVTEIRQQVAKTRTDGSAILGSTGKPLKSTRKYSTWCPRCLRTYTHSLYQLLSAKTPSE